MSSNLYSDFNGKTDEKCQTVGRKYVDISKALNQDEDKQDELCEAQRDMDGAKEITKDLPASDPMVGFGRNKDKEPSGCCKK